MSLLITLGILGAIIVLYALVIVGTDLVIYLIADIKSFKECLDLKIEESRLKRKTACDKRKEKKIAKYQKKLEKQLPKEEVKTTSELIAEEPIEKTEKVEETKIVFPEVSAIAEKAEEVKGE